MNDIIQDLEVNATNGKENFCYISEKQLNAMKELYKREAKEIKQLQQENKQLKNNWNKLKEYLINDINDRNGHKVAEYENGRKVSETISPIYTLMEDKSKTMREVLDKMHELEQENDSNEKISKITG